MTEQLHGFGANDSECASRARRRQAFVRILLNRALPGTMVMFAALTIPEFSVGAGDFTEVEPVGLPPAGREPRSARAASQWQDNADGQPLEGVRYAALLTLDGAQPQTGLALAAAGTLASPANGSDQEPARDAPSLPETVGAAFAPVSPAAAVPPSGLISAAEPAARAPKLPTAALTALAANLPVPVIAEAQAPQPASTLGAVTGSFTALLPEGEQAGLSAPSAARPRDVAVPVVAAKTALVPLAKPPELMPRGVAARREATPVPAPAPVQAAPTAVTQPAAAQPAAVQPASRQIMPAAIAAPAAAAAPRPAPVATPAAVQAPLAKPATAAPVAATALSSTPRATASAAPVPAAAPRAAAPAPTAAPAPAFVAKPAPATPASGAAYAMNIKSQLVTRVDGKAAGAVDFSQTTTGLKVRLGSVVEVLSDRFDAAELARIRTSAAGQAYVSLAELQAQGIPISYDPVYDELNVGLTDTRPKAGRKVHMDQISTPERGIGATGMEQVRR